MKIDNLKYVKPKIEKIKKVEDGVSRSILKSTINHLSCVDKSLLEFSIKIANKSVSNSSQRVTDEERLLIFYR